MIVSLREGSCEHSQQLEGETEEEDGSVVPSVKESSRHCCQQAEEEDLDAAWPCQHGRRQITWEMGEVVLFEEAVGVDVAHGVEYCQMALKYCCESALHAMVEILYGDENALKPCFRSAVWRRPRISV